jgi:hypothetical protein
MDVSWYHVAGHLTSIYCLLIKIRLNVVHVTSRSGFTTSMHTVNLGKWWRLECNNFPSSQQVSQNHNPWNLDFCFPLATLFQEHIIQLSLIDNEHISCRHFLNRNKNIPACVEYNIIKHAGICIDVYHCHKKYDRHDGTPDKKCGNFIHRSRRHRCQNQCPHQVSLHWIALHCSAVIVLTMYRSMK